MMQTRQSSDKGGENAKKESNVMKEFLNENEKLVSENEELVKKNENLAEAVKKLKMFITRSTEFTKDFSQKRLRPPAFLPTGKCHRHDLHDQQGAQAVV